MPENLMCAEHKSNSDEYRKEYERIFKQSHSLLYEKWQAEKIDNDLCDALTGKPQNVIYGEPYGAIPIDPLRFGFLAKLKDNPCPKV